MKAKLFAGMMAVFLLWSLAAAQDYCIRVNRRINLRDAASLQSNVLETVATGTTLRVIGELNRWLRINRNGNEAWMANWVSYSRVDDCGGTQSPQGNPAGTASEIDNCCFVDRQCGTDQEWTEGYWAFQNGQCQAPAQSQIPASSQPTGGAPAQIDNCCFVDRQCRTELDWISGYHAFQNNQCGAPGQTGASPQPGGGVILRTASGVVIGYRGGRSILPSTAPTVFHADGSDGPYSSCCQQNWQCNSDQDRAEGFQAFQTNLDDCSLPGLISIVGDPDFVTYYEQRLDLLKNRLPQRYTYVLDGLNRIEQSRIEGQPSYVYSGLRTFFVAWEDGRPAHTGWDIREPAVLVHEACHAHRHYAGIRSHYCDNDFFAREEVVCMGVELEVLFELGAPAHITEWLSDTIELTRAGKNTYYQIPGC